MGDLVVVFACELVERQKAFVGVEAEVAASNPMRMSGPSGHLKLYGL